MNINSVVKPIVLGTVSVGTGFATQSLLGAVLLKINPKLTQLDENLTRKEKAIRVVAVVGVVVAISVVSAVVSNAASNLVETVVWGETQDVITQ